MRHRFNVYAVILASHLAGRLGNWPAANHGAERVACGGAGTPEHGGAPRRFRVGVGSTYRNRAGAPGPYLPTPPPV